MSLRFDNTNDLPVQQHVALNISRRVGTTRSVQLLPVVGCRPASPATRPARRLCDSRCFSLVLSISTSSLAPWCYGFLHSKCAFSERGVSPSFQPYKDTFSEDSRFPIKHLPLLCAAAAPEHFSIINEGTSI